MSKIKEEPRKKSLWKSILAAVVVGIIVFYFPEWFAKDKDLESTEGLIPVEFVRVIDGDTIRIKYDGEERKVRYLLIDTPETNEPPEKHQPYAEEAMQRNYELLKSGKLEIEFDVGDREDKYDRLLAYIYVDGESVQEKLLEEGLARVAYIYEPNTKNVDVFKEAEAHAKKAGLGIWSIDGYVTNRGFGEVSE